MPHEQSIKPLYAMLTARPLHGNRARDRHEDRNQSKNAARDSRKQRKAVQCRLHGYTG